MPAVASCCGKLERHLLTRGRSVPGRIVWSTGPPVRTARTELGGARGASLGQKSAIHCQYLAVVTGIEELQRQLASHANFWYCCLVLMKMQPLFYLCTKEFGVKKLSRDPLSFSKACIKQKRQVMASRRGPRLSTNTFNDMWDVSSLK